MSEKHLTHFVRAPLMYNVLYQANYGFIKYPCSQATDGIIMENVPVDRKLNDKRKFRLISTCSDVGRYISLDISSSLSIEHGSYLFAPL